MKKLVGARMRMVVIATLAVATAFGFEAARVGAVSSQDDYVHTVQYVSATSSTAKAATKSATATCAAGTIAIGGGAEIKPVGVGAFSIITSKPVLPSSAGTGGWTASAMGLSLAGWSVTAWAVCADSHGTAPTASTSSSSSSGASGSSSGGASSSSGASGSSSGGASSSSGASGSSSGSPVP